VDPRKDFSKDRKDILSTVSNLKRGESNFPERLQEIRDPTPQAEDLKDIECIQLMSQEGHYADKYISRSQGQR